MNSFVWAPAIVQQKVKHCEKFKFIFPMQHYTKHKRVQVYIRERKKIYIKSILQKRNHFGGMLCYNSKTRSKKHKFFLSVWFFVCMNCSLHINSKINLAPNEKKYN